MSISDLSQLSDLSGISRIRSSSIRPSEKADSILNLSEIRTSSFREPTLSNKTVASSRDDESAVNGTKIGKAMAACQEATSEYAKLELIQDSLLQLTERNSEKLQTGTSAKLKDILSVHEANKYLQLPNPEKLSHQDFTLLGITDLPKIQLSHNERREIKAAVENAIREKMDNFIASYERLDGSVADALKNHSTTVKWSSTGEAAHGCELMRWKDQTDEMCSEYYRDLLRCADMIDHWRQLRLNEMRELNNKNAANLLLEARVAQVQATITRKMCALKMMKETPITVDASRLLSSNLDAKIAEAREEIRKKTTLKSTYEVVFTGCDELFAMYTKLVDVIKKKEHLMEML